MPKRMNLLVEDVVFNRLQAEAQRHDENNVAVHLQQMLRWYVHHSNQARVDRFLTVRFDSLSPDEIVLPGVYVVANDKRRRAYIGSSVNVGKRRLQHRSLLRAGTHHNKELQKDWQTDGEGAFRWGILELLPGATTATLRHREFHWMDRYEKKYGTEVLYNTIRRLQIVISDEQLLDALLAQPLPRRERCGTCRHWQSDDGEVGECAEDVPSGRLCDFSLAGDGCVSYYEPRQLQWYDGGVS